jgi:hypothetical protein
MARGSVHVPDATVALRRGLRCRRVEADAAWNRNTQEIEHETILFRRPAAWRARARPKGPDPTIALGDADLLEIPARALAGRDPTIALGDADLLDLRAGRRAVSDPTIAIGDADVLEVRSARAQQVPIFVGDSWSIDIVVGDDGGDAYAADPHEGQRKSLLWRLLVKLGWVKLEEGHTVLGA